MGQRWEEGKQWNLKLETEDGSKIDPALSNVDPLYRLERQVDG
jgi:nitrate reductase alpha subunit